MPELLITGETDERSTEPEVKLICVIGGCIHLALCLQRGVCEGQFHTDEDREE